MFYLLTLIVAASRFLPHPPNVACVGALGLFAGCYLIGRRAYFVPAAVLLISDLVGHACGVPGMGFYSPVAMLSVYLGATLAVPVGRWIAAGQDGRGKRALKTAGGSLVASTVFFILSNLGVWAGGWYAMSLAGLLACFAAAIPFFGYTIVGDLIFTTLLFGAWQWSAQTDSHKSKNYDGAFAAGILS